jgi:hypothetical protein
MFPFSYTTVSDTREAVGDGRIVKANLARRPAMTQTLSRGRRWR